MPPKQYIFFDLGWTLEDETEAQIDRAAKAARAAREFGVDVTGERILALQERGAGEHVPSVFRYALSQLGLDEQQSESVYRQATWDKSLLYLYPDARAVLAELGKRHFIGLIANQSPGAESRLDAYGIRGCFDLVLASSEIGLEKPDPAIFRLAQDRSGCSPGQAWMIGDRLDNDVKPANEAGWHTIRVLNGYNVKQSPRHPGEHPDHTVDELSGVLGILA